MVSRLIYADVLKAVINRETHGRNVRIAAGDVLDIIDEQPDAESTRKWVSVKDKLPSENTDVLLMFPMNMAVGFIREGRWMVNSGCNWYSEVIEEEDEPPQYWMALPEPQKGEHDGSLD